MSSPRRVTLSFTTALVTNLTACHAEEPGRPDISGAPSDTVGLDTLSPDQVSMMREAVVYAPHT